MQSKSLVVTLGLVVVSVFLIYVFSTQEPVYREKPLREWLAQLESGNDIGHSPFGAHSAGDEQKELMEAQAAIRQIGTCALPTLVRMLLREDSRLSLLCREWISRQRVIKVRFVQAETHRRRAFLGLRVLGPQCKYVLPDLIRVLKNNNREIRSLAIQILALMGPDATPAVGPLIHLLETEKGGYRVTPIVALGRIGPSASKAIPLLIKATAEPHEDTAWQAALALAQIGPEAMGPLEEVIMREPPINQKRLTAVWALGRIGGAADHAIPLLLNVFKGNGSELSVRLAALHALGKIGVKDSTAVAELISVSGDANGALRNWSLGSNIHNALFEFQFDGEKPSGGELDIQPGSVRLAGWGIYLSRLALRWEHPVETGGFVIEVAPDHFSGEISQTLLTEAGQAYEVSLLVAAGRNRIMRITAGDSDTTFIPTAVYPQFSPATLTFKATSMLTTITLTAVEEEAFGPLIGGLAIKRK